MDQYLGWARGEGGGSDLGHAARTEREVAMLAQLAATPAGTVAAVFRDAAARTGAYRWLESDRFSWTDVADGIHASCARRCREHARVLVPIDGSSLTHTDLLGDDGVGPIGTRKAGARGLKSMIALVMTYDGVPLGVGAHALWARSYDARPPAHDRALNDRESWWWVALQQQFEQALAQESAATTPWYLMDREADAGHVLLRGLTPGVEFTVRAHYDRTLAPGPRGAGRREVRKLRATLEQAPASARIYLAVPPGPQRLARVARLEVRYAVVPMRLRARWSKKRLGDVTLTAVWAREVGTVPPGAAPLEWLLLTNVPVATADDAVRVVRTYTLRWRLEDVHFTWKSGTCHVEDSQLESFEALARWATLHLSVAVHRQHLLHLARTQPDLPADEVFERTTIDAALTLAAAEQRRIPRPGETPPLGRLVEIIARLGGYTGKSSGGPPGPTTFQRGMERVETAAIALRMQQLLAKPPTPDDSFD